MKYNNGSTQWEYGQPRNNYYDDWHKLLGPCPECGNPCFDYGGGWRCQLMYCKYSSTNPVGNFGSPPSWWNLGINVIKDGSSWMAHGLDFINLQESDVTFGGTPKDAVESYLEIKHLQL